MTEKREAVVAVLKELKLYKGKVKKHIVGCEYANASLELQKLLQPCLANLLSDMLWEG